MQWLHIIEGVANLLFSNNELPFILEKFLLIVASWVLWTLNSLVSIRSFAWLLEQLCLDLTSDR